MYSDNKKKIKYRTSIYSSYTLFFVIKIKEGVGMDIRYEPLPNDLFMVRVPIIATYEDREIDTFGLPFSIDNQGNQFMDTYKELTTVMLPLDKIIDIYIKGFYIAVVNKEDISKIYVILEKYLSGSVSNPNAYINRGFVKEERLEDIERFANEMFGLNKATIVNDAVKESKNNPFGLNLDLMPLITPQQTKLMNYNKTAGPSHVNMPKFSKTLTMDDLPKNHVSYPHVREPKIGDNKPKEVPKHYAYLHDTAPNVNIDISSVKRTSGFRKIYK